LQHTAILIATQLHCDTLQHSAATYTATHCNSHCNTGAQTLFSAKVPYILQHTATLCNTHCNTGTLRHSSACCRNTHCNTLQHNAHYNIGTQTLFSTLPHTLQHTAKHSNTHCNTHCNTGTLRPVNTQNCSAHYHALQHSCNTHCNTLHCTLRLVDTHAHFSALQHAATQTLQETARPSTTLSRVDIRANTHCYSHSHSILQHTAGCCNTH